MFEHFFGEYLIQNNYLTNDQFAEVIRTQKSSRVKLGLIATAEKMLTARQTYEINMLQSTLDKRFGDIAIEKGYLTPEQVEKLLSLQGDCYLSLVQTLIDKNYMTLQEIEAAVEKYKDDNKFSDEELEAVKSDDVDRICEVFINVDKPLYNELISLVIRNIIRFIDTGISFKAPVFVKNKRFDNLASQCVKGDHDIFLGFEGDGNTLLSIATPYASRLVEEVFEEVDEDSLDAICEFINCINGIFASKLSYEDVDIDMLPPLYYNDNELISKDGFYMVPIKINKQEVNLIIGIDTPIVIK